MALVRATTLVRDAMSHSVDIDGTGDGCQSIMPAVAVTDAPCLVPTTAIAPGKAESRTPARRMAVRLSPRLDAASRRPTMSSLAGGDVRAVAHATAAIAMTASHLTRAFMARRVGAESPPCKAER